LSGLTSRSGSSPIRSGYLRAPPRGVVGRVLRYWPGTSDLAVEVVSPGDAYSELHDKALGWLAAGTQLMLVADPATRRVTLYRSPADVTVFEGDQPVNCDPILPAPPARALFP
jgi:Uma2 family endonuclease